MKIQVISDLHLEFGEGYLAFENTDVLVLAGDIHVGTKSIDWLKNKSLESTIIYVLGNHEYYKGSIPKTLKKIKEQAEGTNIHVLENESIKFNDVTFHGCTLWTDFSLFGNPMTYGVLCQSKMNDYKNIRLDPSYSKLRSIDTYRLHNKSVTWLKKSLLATTTQKNIVVTHHAPSIKSIPLEFRNDDLSAAYASNLEGMIIAHEPDYWIHGHVHTPVRYSLGKTEVICNPHGYIDEPYNGYNKKLILEV